MRNYHHLSLEEREAISHGVRHGLSLRAIAGGLGRAHSTVLRELARHSGHGYVAETAHRRSQKRPGRRSKIARAAWLRRYLLDGLARCWSPEQIAGRMRRQKRSYYACHETMYRYIFSEEGRSHGLPAMLPKARPRRRLRARKPRGGIPGAVPVHQRHAPRTQSGHWEADLVLFRFNSTCSITTLVERSTRLSLLLFNPGRYAIPVMDRIARALEPLPPHMKRSVTFDRGREFVKHQRLPVPAFFCDPSSPWQRGTNENTNGRLRRFLPKGRNYPDLSQDTLDHIMNIMNHTPRKCLNYQTPQEAFNRAAKKVVHFELEFTTC